MRNVFDQYIQTENRITHALMTALHEDRQLLRGFLRDIAKCMPPRGALQIEIREQSYPGIPEDQTFDEGLADRRGIPDAWLTRGDWCLLIENKVLSVPFGDQISRHFSIARRLGYTHPKVMLLTIRKADIRIDDAVKVVEWRQIYRWLLDQAPRKPWARRLADFLEVSERQMIDREQMEEGTLTAFNGVSFGDGTPYSYLEAKRVLKLLMADLRKRADLISRIGMAPEKPGRPAVTGQAEDLVWDILQLRQFEGKMFSRSPHLTVAIDRSGISAMLTVPHGLQGSVLRRLTGLGGEGFRDLVHLVVRRMKPSLDQCKGMEPRMIAQQRRWISRRSAPFVDGIMSFDLRTAFKGTGAPRTQPQWLDAVYGCVAEKRSNFEFQVGARFPYRTCPAVATPAILDWIVEAWLACGPVAKVLAGTTSTRQRRQSRKRS